MLGLKDRKTNTCTYRRLIEQEIAEVDALKCVVQAKRGSTSLLQRHLRIGYGRAAAILDAMVREGYIGEMDGSTRARPVLPKAYEDLQDISEMLNEE